jgi:t-SNARE complex subunit (syntaxin)
MAIDRLGDLKLIVPNVGCRANKLPEYLLRTDLEQNEDTDYYQTRAFSDARKKITKNLAKVSISCMEMERLEIQFKKETIEEKVTRIISAFEFMQREANQCVSESQDILKNLKTTQKNDAELLEKANAGKATLLDEGLIPDETQFRMRDGQLSAWSSHLMALVEAVHKRNVSFRTTYRSMMENRIRILNTKGEWSNTEISEMVKNDPHVLQNIIRKKLGSRQLVDNVRRLEEKCQEFKKLEDQVRILVDLIKDISAMVHEQGKQVDSIAGHVTNAKNYVAAGNKKLDKAKEHQKAARNRMCCIILIVCVIMCLVLGPVIGTFG